jgi:hypothetical protein
LHLCLRFRGIGDLKQQHKVFDVCQYTTPSFEFCCVVCGAKFEVVVIFWREICEVEIFFICTSRNVDRLASIRCGQRECWVSMGGSSRCLH